MNISRILQKHPKVTRYLGPLLGQDLRLMKIWLLQENKGLGGAVPLELMKTSEGEDKVIGYLHRISGY